MILRYRELALQYNEAPLLSSVLHADAPCAGRGVCGKCRVRARGGLSAPTAEERALLSAEELQSGWRLACQARVLGDIDVDVPERRDMLVQLDFSDNALPARHGGEGVALAVDIGTTTLAAYACDMKTGAVLARGACENPQRMYGADVISRVAHALSGGLCDLTRVLRERLDALANDIAREAGLPSASGFAHAVLTGNTCMLLLLVGDLPAALAAAPFRQDRLFGETLPARALLSSFAESAKVYLPRCMAAFVGADITCALLAADIPDDKTTLLCDIGTNGEIALSHKGRLTVCATAAGPAFEGAGVSCAGPARPGAVDRVWLESGAIRYTTIGGEPPTHFCGSGLIDACAALLALETIEPSGRVVGDTTIAGLTLTQADVRAMQLAKAAICAGMLTLLSDAGLTVASIDELLLAGGFGTRMDARSAAYIGLIPPESAAKARAIGNAAGAGAALLAADASRETACEAIARSARVVDLTASARFMAEYVEQMAFPEE